MILAHRIQLDPTNAQVEYFKKACGASRFTYNWALAEWNKQFSEGLRPNAFGLKKQFNAIKYKQFPWLKSIHKDAHARPFFNLQTAWSRYLGKAKSNGNPKNKVDLSKGRPVFKKKNVGRDSFYIGSDRVSINNLTIKLPIIGNVHLTERLRFSGKIKCAVISRQADRWFVSVVVAFDQTSSAPPKGPQIGVDFGLSTFATLSTGEKVIAPKPLKKNLKKLQKLGRCCSRKKLGSKNRKKAAILLAKQHQRITNSRQDFLHKFTSRLATEYSEICIEDLHVKGMLKNHKLAFHISDAAWGETRRQLQYKTVLYCSKLTIRDRFYASSKICSNCGQKNNQLKLLDREWKCKNCDKLHNRDLNASINLLSHTVGYTGIHASGD